jgi:all-trans-8'-apo-beta-carotenal 15,15'-oxygenase
MIHKAHTGKEHRYGYFAKSTTHPVFWNAVLRLNMDTGAQSLFDFGENVFCGEPVFVPDPDHLSQGPGDERGWVLALCHNGNTRRSFLAVLDAENVSAGPLARIHLNHHAPMTFHGVWHPS